MRALLILLISTLLLTANDKIALVIGNKNYTNQTGLKNPIRDAKLLKETLRGLGFTVIEVYNADVDTISNKLSDFASKANHAKVAVIYYAGHGVGVEGKNYLIPLNATNLSRATLPKKLISLDELQEAVSGAKGFGVVLFDACRNSFFSGKIRGLSGNRASRALVQPQASSKNTLVSFSTQAGKLAKDDVNSAEHSPYAIALSEKLKLKKDIRLVMGGVKERVERLTHYEQEPISRSSLGGDAFCLTGCGYTPPPPPTPTPKPTSTSKWIKPSDSVCEANGGQIYKGFCQANWKNSKKICKASGGRLPTKEELLKVVTDCGGIVNSVWNGKDASKNKNNNYYQNCYKKKGFTSDYYWSSTTHASYTSFAWFVNFNNGFTNNLNKSYNYNVRCVRTGQ